LKFDEFVDCAEHGGGDGALQVRFVGEKLILIAEPPPLGPGVEAMPEKEKLPLKAGNEPVTVPLNVVELGVNGIEPMIGKPLEFGELSISKSISEATPGPSPDALTERL
jgi:hypothetical protein